MRKVLCVLPVLLIAGITIFAQEEPKIETSFSTQIYTGLNYNAGDGTIVAGDSDNLGDSTSRLNFTGVFTLGSFGAKFTLRAQNIANDAWQPSYTDNEDTALVLNNVLAARRAFVFYNFLEGKIYVAAGLPGIGDFSTSYNGAVAFDNAVPGVLATIKPFEGFELGCFLPVSSNAADLSAQLNASTVAAMYEIPKAATVQAWVFNFNDFAAVADINITAVENLTLSAEMDYNSGGDKTLALTEQVGYTIDKFTPLFVSSQTLPESGDVTFTIEPSVTFALSDTIELAAEYSYDSSSTNHVIDAYAKFMLENNYIKLKPGYDTADGRGFFVKLVFVAEF
jgi:hypothetical protein